MPLPYPALVNFGPSSAGLNTVGYQLKEADGGNEGSRVTTGVSELGTNTGIYRATVTIPWWWASYILWDTGQGAATKYAAEAIHHPGMVWEAEEMQHGTLGTFGSRLHMLEQDMIRSWVWNAPLINYAGVTTFGGSLQYETAYGGDVAAATGTTIQLGTNEGTTNNYTGWGVSIHSGLGAGQYRTIASYVPATRTATLDRAWATNPDTTSTYKLWPPVTLDAGGLDTVPIEAGHNLRKTLSAIAAATAGVETRPTATTVAYAGIGVATNRITATIDPGNGRRSAVTLSL